MLQVQLHRTLTTTSTTTTTSITCQANYGGIDVDVDDDDDFDDGDDDDEDNGDYDHDEDDDDHDEDDDDDDCGGCGHDARPDTHPAAQGVSPHALLAFRSTHGRITAGEQNDETRRTNIMTNRGLLSRSGFRMGLKRSGNMLGHTSLIRS